MSELVGCSRLASKAGFDFNLRFLGWIHSPLLPQRVPYRPSNKESPGQVETIHALPQGTD